MRREHFPNPAFAPQPHHVAPTIPLIEIAHHRHALRIRRPDGERHPAHAIDFTQMRPQLLERPQMRAFGQQPDIGVAQHRPEAVRVFQFGGVAAPVHLQQIAQPGRRRRHQCGEHVGVPVARQYRQRIARTGMDHRHGARPGQQGANAEPLTRHVRPQHRERIVVLGAHQGADFGLRKLVHANFRKCQVTRLTRRAEARRAEVLANDCGTTKPPR